VYAYADDATIYEALEKISNNFNASGQPLKKNWKEDEKMLLTLCGLK